MKSSIQRILFSIWDAILLKFQTPTTFTFDDILFLNTFSKLGGTKVEEWGLPSFLVHDCHLISMGMQNYYYIQDNWSQEEKLMIWFEFALTLKSSTWGTWKIRNILTFLIYHDNIWIVSMICNVKEISRLFLKTNNILMSSSCHQKIFVGTWNNISFHFNDTYLPW